MVMVMAQTLDTRPDTNTDAKSCNSLHLGARFLERLPDHAISCKLSARFQDRRYRPLSHPSGADLLMISKSSACEG